MRYYATLMCCYVWVYQYIEIKVSVSGHILLHPQHPPMSPKANWLPSFTPPRGKPDTAQFIYGPGCTTGPACAGSSTSLVTACPRSTNRVHQHSSLVKCTLEQPIYWPNLHMGVPHIAVLEQLFDRTMAANAQQPFHRRLLALALPTFSVEAAPRQQRP